MEEKLMESKKTPSKTEKSDAKGKGLQEEEAKKEIAPTGADHPLMRKLNFMRRMDSLKEEGREVYSEQIKEIESMLK